MSSLSKKHKDDNEKEKKRNILANKTVKNYSTPSTQTITSFSASSYQPSLNMPDVNLELPDELKETFTPVLIEPSLSSIKINHGYSNDNPVPYGCLKGGVKPTYRTWNATRKNYDQILLDTPIIQPQQP